jgi:hypothetical protein
MSTSQGANHSYSTLIEWAEHAVGQPMLAYLLGCDSASLVALQVGSTDPSNAQQEVLGGLEALQRAIPLELDPTSVRSVIRNWLIQQAPSSSEGLTVARYLHEHAVESSEEAPSATGDIEAAIIALALDVYPAFLIPLDEDEYPSLRSLNVYASRTASRHPQSREFCRAALKDPVLGQVWQYENEGLKEAFAPEDEFASRISMFFTNTGGGSSIQLAVLPGMLLRAAWQRPDRGSSARDFALAAARQLELVRSVLSGGHYDTVARLAFAGVLLPPAMKIELSDSLIRPLAETERAVSPQLAPGGLAGPMANPRHLTAQNADGTTVVISLDGDLVLEYPFPYKVRVTPMPDDPVSFPEDMYPPETIDQAAIRLRFSLLMAVERQTRVLLVQTWRQYDDPLATGQFTGWNDPVFGTGLMPTQLTEADVDAWRTWYEKLRSPHVVRIYLALTRILRACAERRDPADVLVDSVIAWENLFGTKEGEPTFRITMSLAVLLRSTKSDRATLRSRLSHIYALRSKIVHGSANLRRADIPLCYEALDVAISAVRVLISERPEVLELKDGAERSTQLLLHSSVGL